MPSIILINSFCPEWFHLACAAEFADIFVDFYNLNIKLSPEHSASNADRPNGAHMYHMSLFTKLFQLKFTFCLCSHIGSLAKNLSSPTLWESSSLGTFLAGDQRLDNHPYRFLPIKLIEKYLHISCPFCTFYVCLRISRKMLANWIG